MDDFLESIAAVLVEILFAKLVFGKLGGPLGIGHALARILSLMVILAIVVGCLGFLLFLVMSQTSGPPGPR